jgi:adenine phosphoribosyltransferase
MTAEVKSIPLAHALSVRMGIPYVIARKTRKPYMVGATSVEVLSITTGAPQTLWLDGKDKELIDGKRIILVDDVISTGSTLLGMRKLVESAGGRVVAEAAVFTEGNDPNKWRDIVAVGNLPVFCE